MSLGAVAGIVATGRGGVNDPGGASIVPETPSLWQSSTVGSVETVETGKIPVVDVWEKDVSLLSESYMQGDILLGRVAYTDTLPAPRVLSVADTEGITLYVRIKACLPRLLPLPKHGTTVRFGWTNR